MEQVSGQLDGQIAPLPVGIVAPNFTVPQALHPPLALHSLSRHPMVLVFYPFDWEPVSREQLTLYQDFSVEFNRFGARLLGLSVDHMYSHDAFARDAGIEFPLLADSQPRGATARQYGVYREGHGVCARGLFVLDEQRIIRFSKTYPDLLNPGVDELLTTLETLAQEKQRMEGAETER